MTLPSFVDGATLPASDMREIINHLQGAAGKTDAWHFRSSAGNNYLVTLADAAGAQKFSVRDSGGVEVFSVDSDGNVTVTGTLTQSGALIVPTSASPAQTTEGSVVWDTDDDALTVGTGSSRATLVNNSDIFIPIAKAADETVTSSSTLQDDDDFTFAMEANSRYLIDIYLLLNSGVTPDFKWLASVPSGATASGYYTSTAQWTLQGDVTTGTLSIAGSNGEVPQRIIISVVTSSTAGNFTFQWAQQTSDGSDTIVAKGSLLGYRKVA